MDGHTHSRELDQRPRLAEISGVAAAGLSCRGDGELGSDSRGPAASGSPSLRGGRARRAVHAGAALPSPECRGGAMAALFFQATVIRLAATRSGALRFASRLTTFS